MASGKCQYLQQAIADFMLGQTSYTPPTDLYIALSTAAWSRTATGAGFSEVSASGTAYARIHVVNDGTNWGAADSTGQKANLLDLAYATVTATYGTVRSFYLLDGNAGTSSDHCLYGSDITPVVIGTGPGPVFAAGALVVKET
jgi:hypothetical protein